MHFARSEGMSFPRLIAWKNRTTLASLLRSFPTSFKAWIIQVTIFLEPEKIVCNFCTVLKTKRILDNERVHSRAKKSNFNIILSRCLKITEKVSFNIASEASYVWIFEWTKVLKKCQNWSVLFVQKLVELKKSHATFRGIFKQCVL